MACEVEGLVGPVGFVWAVGPCIVGIIVTNADWWWGFEPLAFVEANHQAPNIWREAEMPGLVHIPDKAPPIDYAQILL